LARSRVAIFDSLRTDGPCAYGITARSSSNASFRSCIRRRSRAFIVNRTFSQQLG